MCRRRGGPSFQNRKIAKSTRQLHTYKSRFVVIKSYYYHCYSLEAVSNDVVVYRRVHLSYVSGDLLLDRGVVVVAAATAESAHRVGRTFRRRGTHGHHRPTAVRFSGHTVRQSTHLQEPFQGGCVKGAPRFILGADE